MLAQVEPPHPVMTSITSAAKPSEKRVDVRRMRAVKVGTRKSELVHHVREAQHVGQHVPRCRQ